MQPARKHLLTDVIVPLCLALGVLVPLFYQVVVLGPQQPDNLEAFYSFSGGLEGYGELKDAWKPRLFSNALAWQVDRLSAVMMGVWYVRYINRPQPLAMGLWTIGWFFVLSLVYIWFRGRRSSLYILGTYAALTFGYVDKLPATRVYPWDMPALLIYALFLFLFLENRVRWLLFLLPVGMGFKETVGILTGAFLLSAGMPWRRRWSLFLATAGLCALVKLAIGAAVGTSQPFFTMETGIGGRLEEIYLVNNLRTLIYPQVLLVNAGLLLSFALLPGLDPKWRALKWLALVFAVGNFLFGTVAEYRIWFELIPFALYGLEATLFGAATTSAAREPAASS